MSTVWTRTTGWLTLIGAVVTEVWALLPALSPEAVALSTPARLLPLLVTTVCALGWLAASAAARRRERARRSEFRPGLDKRPPRTPGRPVTVLLGVALALGPTAALAQAVGPDGAEGRWTQRVLRAGGGTYTVEIAEVLGTPRRTGVSVNDHQVWSAPMVLTVPWSDGEPRRLTLDRVETLDEPEPGDSVSLMFAANDLELGARSHQYGAMSGIAGLWILILGLLGSILTAGMLTSAYETVGRLRAFAPGTHLPAAALLALGAGLDLLVVFAWPPTGVGWLLALAAATTPPLAAWWTLRRLPYGR
ncbi:hypothetical protein ADK60_41085 [Streptomyces sp. XY431]|uniref:hypothetical protein n=1 Tax=Streptomyces sp. XY431 TaxID=1415562 RepID=UPI0006AF710D|nr:hypothetical protein [Streptomyces sp. XY431]KOV09476.1 hypothetical protein ADK60_41085 [Streptomyces sp. XY431]